MTPQELTEQLAVYYGWEVDMTYAVNYIELTGETAEVNGYYLWLKDLNVIV